ncbi:MAG: hypothetical protein GY835_10805 [bacterium]|nr:hypothetical protein [bacterium]
MRRPLIAITLLFLLYSSASAQESAPPRFDCISKLPAAVAADSSLIGSVVDVQGQVTADFYRDVYLGVIPVVNGDQTAGFRIAAGEHLAEVWHQTWWRGTLKYENGELYLDARRAGMLKAIDGLVSRYGRSESMWEYGPWPYIADAARLLAAPEEYRGRFIQLNDGVVTAIRRDGNGVPWLMVAEFGTNEISIELQDGNAPVIKEGDALVGIRGIWYRKGRYWQVRPRSRNDFTWFQVGDHLDLAVPGDEYEYPSIIDFRGKPGDELTCLNQNAQLEAKFGGTVGKRRGGYVLFDEICHDPAEPGDGEGAESFAVVNVGNRKIKIGHWTVTDNEGSWYFPRNTVVEAGEKVYVARNAERFYFEFGFPPDFSFDKNPCPEDSALILGNSGDELLLLNPRGLVADAVAIEKGEDLQVSCWTGRGVWPYRFATYVPEEGQVLWRKRDPKDNRRLDTDTAKDWISDPDDPDLGRQMAYPGWDRDLFWDTARCSEKAEVTAFISPDNCFAGIRDFIRSAEESLEIEFYLITHPTIVDELLAAMERGVRVVILLNGEIFGARGGTYDSVRGLMSLIVAHESGLGQVYLWRNGDDPRHQGMDADIPDRYNHPHQKFMIADRQRVLVGSDNLTQSSVPADDKSNGTNGSRGVFLVTDASCVVERLIAIWETDCDPDHQRDVHIFVSRDDLDESLPRAAFDRTGYEPVQATPFTSTEKASFELSQSPDNCLRPDRAYLGLINRAGEGDWILVEQQYERPWWGHGVKQIPNPRLQACVLAARRGASVRILVSGSGGRGRNAKNIRMAESLNSLALEQGLDLHVGLGSLPEDRPNRDRPIHNKMLLARIGREYWSHVGSANGSETAHRFNREVGLSIESQGLFDYLSTMFTSDWRRNVAVETAPLPERW